MPMSTLPKLGLMHRKATAWIVLIVFVTAAASFLSGLYITNDSLDDTLEQDLRFAIGIADDLVSTQMRLMKSSAAAIAQRLETAGSRDELTALMAAQARDCADIFSLSVFDNNGVFASSGVPPHNDDPTRHTRYMELVNGVQAVITGPFYSPGESKSFINVYTPMSAGRVLAVTLPGAVFSDLLARHRLWESGDIFLLNEEGAFIGTADPAIVRAMDGALADGGAGGGTGAGTDTGTGQGNEETVALVKQILATENGVLRYHDQGTERVCAYSRLDEPALGWRVAVTLPLRESPQAGALRGQIYAAAFFLIAGVVAAFFLSRLLTGPFKQIEAQHRALSGMSETTPAQAAALRGEREHVPLLPDASPPAGRPGDSELRRGRKKMPADIERRDHLLQIVNQAADLLLSSGTEDFPAALYQCMGMLAGAIGADHMHLNKNYSENGRLYRKKVYEWSADTEGFADVALLSPIAYDETTPAILETMLGGECLNCTAGEMSDADRERLSPQGVLAVLMAPVFIRGEFWGVVGFNNCHKEELFKQNEVPIIRSGCLLIVNALLRYEDMLRLRHTSARLEIALKEARQANRSKSDFLAGISHEMRTPLNAIIGLSEIGLENSGLDGETRNNLEKISYSGSTLLSIINDLLDISKVQAGKFVIIEKQYDLPSLVNDALIQNLLRIGSKPIHFTLEIDENLPARLRGDELRIKQIINNLLSNAIKYTDSGNVDLTLGCERDGDALWLTIRVRDTGIGLRPEHLKQLFTDYLQFGATSRRQAGGTGLGLAITKSLAELMGGTITVQSEYGKGSVFTVRLRQRPVGDTVIGPETAENLRRFQYTASRRQRNADAPRLRLPYARVLVVDDNVTNLDVARGLMKPYGMQVDCLTGGLAAIAAVREEKVKYNAIFMDHMMPEPDGVETVRVIREDIGSEYARNVPIIALTANATVGNEAMFLSKGFQGFISKPIDLARLDEIIRRFLRDREQEKLLGGAPAEDRDGDGPAHSRADFSLLAGVSVPGVNLQAALERFGGDEDVMIDVLRSYVENTPTLLEEMKEYLASESLGDYAIAIHGIKGASYGISAQEAGKAAEALQTAAKAGDLAAVKAAHQAFEQMTESLMRDIVRALDQITATGAAPALSFPETAGPAQTPAAASAVAPAAAPASPAAALRKPDAPPRAPLLFTAPEAEILIVEDNETNRKVALGLLKPLRLRIDTAANGREALAMAQKKRYDLILMDHMMPVMDGIEATRELRQMDGGRHRQVPVIALSANETPGARESFLAAGMDDFIAKPLELKEICEKLRRWLPASLLRETPQAEKNPTASAASAASSASAAPASPAASAAQAVSAAQTAPVTPADGTAPFPQTVSATTASSAAQPAPVASAAQASPAVPANPARSAAPVTASQTAPAVPLSPSDASPPSPPAAPAAQTSDSPDDIPPIEGIDIRDGLRYSGSKELFLSLLGDFYKLIDLKSAKIEQYLADGLLREAAIETHALKNTARTIGAGELAAGFYRLEQYGKAEDRPALEREAPAVLALYRSYKPILRPFGEVAEGEKIPATDEEIIALLRQLRAAMDNFDLDGADEALARLETLRLPAACRPQMENLRAYVADVAIEEVIALTDTMINSIENTVK